MKRISQAIYVACLEKFILHVTNTYIMVYTYFSETMASFFWASQSMGGKGLLLQNEIMKNAYRII